MIIVCTGNDFKHLSPNRLHALSQWKNHYLGLDELEIGKHYDVFGVIYRAHSPWYYVFADTNDDFPVAVPEDFFDIVDPNIPPDMSARIVKGNDGSSTLELIPAFWLDCEDVLERLIDGETEACEKMQTFVENRRLNAQKRIATG